MVPEVPPLDETFEADWPSTSHFVAPLQATMHELRPPHFTSTAPVPPATVQPPFGQSTLQLAVPSQVTRQLPSGQSNEQVCPGLHTNWQLPDSHLREQPSLQTHCEEPLQTCPALSLLLLQATTAKRMAIEEMKREAPVRMFMRLAGARRVPLAGPCF